MPLWRPPGEALSPRRWRERPVLRPGAWADTVATLDVAAAPAVALVVATVCVASAAVAAAAFAAARLVVLLGWVVIADITVAPHSVFRTLRLCSATMRST